jgi:2-succinyl-6-hydroxy-2,4-cyclohexadiene-1-carboxylate synthase
VSVAVIVGAVPADVVLLHGFTQTQRSWDGVRERLDRQRYRAVAPDLRGHGAAAGLRPVDFPSVRVDLDALVPAGAVLVGYSMGGRIALDWALRRRERLAGLVLVASSPGLAGDQERAERRAADERLAARVERMDVAAFADEWGALPLWAGQPPAVAAAARADRLRQSPAGLAAALRGLGTGVMTPSWDALPALTVPVRLVVGDRDAKFRGIAERMAEALPAASVDLVADAGHAVALERPEAVVEAIAALA